jgi:hypothetical protein
MLSPDQINEIEQLAALQFSSKEVAIITGHGDAGPEFAELDEFSQAMLRGQLSQVAKLRTEIFKHALNGSSPAQVLALELIQQQRVANAGE